MRDLSIIDKIIEEFTIYNKLRKIPLKCSKKFPSDNILDGILSKEELKHSSGLIRVDYTGEICAQGLYRGQAIIAKLKQTKKYLYHIANEEYNHLVWCGKRLQELGAKPSIFNSFWYWGSFITGIVAGIINDNISYSFIVESEKQVVKHINFHLKNLPLNDNRSRKMLEQINIDELNHINIAKKNSYKELPNIIKFLMRLQSKFMIIISYRF